jgi:hypothetical protein
MVGARDVVVTRVEEERAVVGEDGGPELKGRGVRLAVELSLKVTPLSRVNNSGLATPSGHCSVSMSPSPPA